MYFTQKIDKKYKQASFYVNDIFYDKIMFINTIRIKTLLCIKKQYMLRFSS